MPVRSRTKPWRNRWMHSTACWSGVLTGTNQTSCRPYVSLFNPDVGIYEYNNNGGWYNFGFVLGAGSSGSGANSAVT